jgi:starch synthase
MEILFITAEAAPWTGLTSEARTCAALPKALRGLGHRVTVVSPLYEGIQPAALNLARRLMKLEFEIGGEPVACELYDGRTAAGVELLFIGHEGLFGKTRALTEGTEEEVARRAGAFARAVAGLVETREPRPERVHGHGWVGALALARLGEAVPSLLTVHDAGAQGVFPSALQPLLGIPDELRAADGVEQGGRVNTLHAGLLRASRVTATSPSRARELCGTGGAGLGPVYAALGTRLVGIAMGVDSAVYNPATDALLPARFDPMDLSGKHRTRGVLQRELGLPVREEACVVGTLHVQEPTAGGLELLGAAAPAIVRNDVQLAVVTDASGPAVKDLQDLAERFPDRVAVKVTDDARIARLALAGSDVLAVASASDLATHLCMSAQRYGTLPVAHRGSPASDVVVDCDAKLETGSGFLFDEPTGGSLADAVARAVTAYARPVNLTALRRRVMRLDHSWEKAARLYDRQYTLAAGEEE